MRRRFMKSKIHRARVTGADLNYEGSISLDPRLMKEADIADNEQVAIYNLNNGARFETYAIPGGEGEVCLNGAGARLAYPGDLIIIVTYADYEDQELPDHKPVVVFASESELFTSNGSEERR